MDETLGDLPTVTAIADDIVVYGFKDDCSDQDENLHAVLQRARETSLLLTWTSVNSDALEFASLAIS